MRQPARVERGDRVLRVVVLQHLLLLRLDLAQLPVLGVEQRPRADAVGLHLRLHLLEQVVAATWPGPPSTVLVPLRGVVQELEQVEALQLAARDQQRGGRGRILDAGHRHRDLSRGWWLERISGDSVPSGSMRLRRMSTDVFRSSCVIVWPGSGRASSTTSRPPRRSSPSRKSRSAISAPQTISSASTTPRIARFCRFSDTDARV